ncbi:MAG: hypothetical protein IJ723_06290, partial [Ruminococcus sp.]|nr:hypothetical protein [Ruminococcus sp.]
MEYYSELIEESDNPGEQMEKLGTPEELAERIKRESGWIQPSDGMPSGGRDIPPQSFSGAQQSAGSSGGVAARIIALVCTSPLWLSAFIVLASLFIVIWSVYVVFPSGAVSALISSFMEMKTYAAYGVLLLMAMLAFAGLTLLLANPAVNLTRLTSYGISGFAKMLFAPAAKHGSFKWKAMNRLIAIVGAGLLAAGLVGGGIVYAFARPTAEKYASKLDLVSEEYELSASAQTVKMDISIGDVTVKKSEDGKAKLKVVNIEKEGLTVEDGSGISITYNFKDEVKDHFNFDLF